MDLKRKHSPPGSNTSFSYQQGFYVRPELDDVPLKRLYVGREEPLDLTTKKRELGPSSPPVDSSLKVDTSLSHVCHGPDYKSRSHINTTTYSPKAPTALKKRLLRDFWSDPGGVINPPTEGGITAPFPKTVAPSPSLPAPSSLYTNIGKITPHITINSYSSPKFIDLAPSYQESSLKMRPSPSTSGSQDCQVTYSLMTEAGQHSPFNRPQEGGSLAVCSVRENVHLSDSTISSVKKVPHLRPWNGRQVPEHFYDSGLQFYPPAVVGNTLPLGHPTDAVGHALPPGHPAAAVGRACPVVHPPGVAEPQFMNQGDWLRGHQSQRPGTHADGKLQNYYRGNSGISNTQCNVPTHIYQPFKQEVSPMHLTYKESFETSPSKKHVKDVCLGAREKSHTHVSKQRKLKPSDQRINVEPSKTHSSPLSPVTSLPALVPLRPKNMTSYCDISSDPSLKIPVPVPVSKLQPVGGGISESVEVSCRGLSGGNVKTFPVVNKLGTSRMSIPYKPISRPSFLLPSPLPKALPKKIPIPIPVSEFEAIRGKIEEYAQVSHRGMTGGSMKTFPVLNKLKTVAVVEPYTDPAE